MNAAILGQIVVELAAKTDKYDKDLRNSMHTTQDVAEGMGKSFIVAAGIIETALLGIVTTSVVKFAQFDSMMVKSTAIMVGVTDKMTEKLGNVAESLSVQSKTSAPQAAEAYYFLTSAGLGAVDSMNALNKVNNFAIAGDFDLANATTLLADSQSALGLRTSDTTENLRQMVRVSDVLLKANILANASTEQFAIALTTKSAAAMRLLNKDVEEGVAVLAVWANQGVKAQLAGDQFAIMLRETQTASIENKEAWRAMGLEVYDANGKMLKIADIIENITKKLGPLSDEQKKEALAMLGFSDRSQGAVISLMGFSDQIREYEKELRNAGGLTEEVADKQMQSYINQMKVTGNVVDYVATAIGKKFLPQIVDTMKMFASWLVEVKEDEAHLTVLAKILTDLIIPALIGTTLALGALGLEKVLSLIRTLIVQAYAARTAMLGLMPPCV